MGEGVQSCESLNDRLSRVGCPHKLYEARLRALEVVTRRPLVALVTEGITARIAAAGGAPSGAEQFERDLKTYGLYEAILYFHSYPPLDEEFIDDACALYGQLGGLYLQHHQELSKSDDPRVLAQLHLLRRVGDSREHAVHLAARPPRVPAGAIAAPERPSVEVGYERRLGIHSDLLDVTSWLAKRPLAPAYGCFADELSETLAAQFMFEGFPGVQAAFFDVAEVLDEHEIDVFGAEGQYLLERLVGNLGEEMFGDYEHWIPCVSCGEEFFVEVSLGSVNASLRAGGWRCEACGGVREGEG